MVRVHAGGQRQEKNLVFCGDILTKYKNGVEYLWVFDLSTSQGVSPRGKTTRKGNHR